MRRRWRNLLPGIDASLKYLGNVSRDGFQGAEEREVEIPVGGGNTQVMPAPRYVTGFPASQLLFSSDYRIQPASEQWRAAG